MASFVDSTARDAVAITPSDSTVLEDIGAIYVGGDGTVVVTTQEDNDITFVGLVAGTILPLCVSKVKATGTTATNLVGFVATSIRHLQRNK